MNKTSLTIGILIGMVIVLTLSHFDLQPKAEAAGGLETALRFRYQICTPSTKYKGPI